MSLPEFHSSEQSTSAVPLHELKARQAWSYTRHPHFTGPSSSRQGSARTANPAISWLPQSPRYAAGPTMSVSPSHLIDLRLQLELPPVGVIVEQRLTGPRAHPTQTFSTPPSPAKQAIGKVAAAGGHRG